MMPNYQDIRRLRAMADKINRDEAYFQDRHGDPAPGSVRENLLKDADALRRVADYAGKAIAKGAA